MTPGAGDEFESEARAPQAPPTPFAMVIVVALAVPGLALALLALEFRGRGRRLDLPRGATARFRQRAKAGVRAALARSAASDGTAPPAHAEADATDGKAPAPIAHATGPDGPEPVRPVQPASTAASPEGGSAGPGATEPLESGLPAASPPDPGRPWTAEIDWGNDAGVWSFTVVASSGGEDARAIVTSAPVQWPPASPAAVQSLIDTVDALASSLTAAGWTPLPPGEPWYARRFAWHPVAVAPPASAPGDGTTSTGILEPPAQGARTAVTR